MYKLHYHSLINMFIHNNEKENEFHPQLRQHYLALKCLTFTEESFVSVPGSIFPGTWGRNFVGSIIGIIFRNIKHMIVFKFVGM